MADVRLRHTRARTVAMIMLILVLLLGLPLAVWLDLLNLTDAALRRQASDLNSVITSMRGFYGNNVVGRVLAAPPGTTTQVTHNYQAIPGAIPIPATLSLELGRVISEQQHNITYRFVSDYPFKNRAPHVLDDFERKALAGLRADPHQLVTDVSNSLFNDRIRLIAPVIMGAACVECHNSHAESPKRDWKVGDVRGIQEVTITSPIAANIFSFKYLLMYFIMVAAAGLTFILMQRRQAATIRGMNQELETANEFLASLSMKISRYLSPQIYKSIFSGQKDVTIHTERKKLTIFFSDIKDFTATTERLQPEQITRLLNEYFTEMSEIALRHGGTIDKFVGDAMLIFFGDPDSKGEAEDATACMRMALEMQRRIAELNAKWRNQGVENPFRVRMGVNTGFCNVGNFGSSDRMDYTIIGAEANLAARLQSIAEPGHVVVSYETYALVRRIVVAHPLPPITMKGISRDVIPYAVDGMLDASGDKVQIFSEHMTGLDFYLDPAMIDARQSAHVREVLRDAIATLEKQGTRIGAAH
ncbi:MAG: adenylate/guanylate cyclase domain-containing protein [Xanthobacteraceae bacterium]|nr:adenylate/guanylate cyclase domain-containing protein [Xanthobacteraceae bacterium]MBV9631376.1 adenylate/guanylate cyclase domain-containing protein [Xanthobacteraceae bacterium]